MHPEVVDEAMAEEVVKVVEEGDGDGAVHVHHAEGREYLRKFSASFSFQKRTAHFMNAN